MSRTSSALFGPVHALERGCFRRTSSVLLEGMKRGSQFSFNLHFSQGAQVGEGANDREGNTGEQYSQQKSEFDGAACKGVLAKGFRSETQRVNGHHSHQWRGQVILDKLERIIDGAQGQKRDLHDVLEGEEKLSMGGRDCGEGGWFPIPFPSACHLPQFFAVCAQRRRQQVSSRTLPLCYSCTARDRFSEDPNMAKMNAAKPQGSTGVSGDSPKASRPKLE